ncbi:MAG: DUF4926 domain-containing protein [Anaerolineaceae bacterium]|nr:DUF4926 domain-containing protein [Anaerolineaceae bacterium]
MIPLYKSCALVVDLPAQGQFLDRDLRAGDRGAVVEIYENGAAYAVEFFEEDGSTIGVAWVNAEKIRPVTESQPAAS